MLASVLSIISSALLFPQFKVGKSQKAWAPHTIRKRYRPRSGALPMLAGVGANASRWPNDSLNNGTLLKVLVEFSRFSV
jgi:hypothetical protein